MWDKIIYSFPIQLLILHLKKNLFLVALWVLLALIILQQFGTVLGIPFLFLDPEYLNEVSWQGFFLVGVTLAIFTMSFHMTTYILDGSKFKFLAVVPRPFIHYCINNSIIPLGFYILYLVAIITFQLDNEHENNWIILVYFLGFAAGTLTTYTLMFVYFALTNKDFFKLFADSVEKRLRKTKIPRANMLRRIKESQKAKDKVVDFLDLNMRFRPVRQDLARFETHQLLRVFDQNHLNMVLIQIGLISLILILGLFRENPFLQIPAAASSILLFSILTMVVGALAFWLRDWSTPIVIGAILLFNVLSSTEILNRPHTAFGMDYDSDPAVYDLDHLNKLLHADSVAKDKQYALKILENWKAKFPAGSKPKMVFVATSGGGQRAALWTVRVLQEVEKASENQFFKHTQMISGASGGVVGAAFFRELYLRAADEKLDLYDPKYLDQISADNLNPIIFTLLVNDLLIRNQSFHYYNRKYLKDRGYAFENQFNINTKGIMEKPIGEYRIPEFESKIPMLPVTPLITNDGRKLYIAPSPMAYMGISLDRADGVEEKSQGIDFQRFFAHHGADQLRFISALRMGATFPFITPNVQLPSSPRMETMDSGLSDNFGVQDALRFMYVFQDWIAENTSGVVLVTIRDSEKFSEIQPKQAPTLFEKLFTPIKNIYINWDNVQTLNNEVTYNRMKESMPFNLERIEFEYSTLQYLKEMGLADQEGVFNPKQQEILRASLNWRLTAREKKSIIDNIQSHKNQQSMEKLKAIDFLQ
ncbi:patatin-like phospholipase family protein [Aquiflexum sp. LQ15W]|uniref:patatin-like phospholipase family protein n=1 Tax=Cognataquiflexum nitidum TaxID=2922272 RepID=UPI001F139AF1|nr:patatin-like phospholipase family protein [Cognataquiflexum nitidum]MCH6199312.1 patatin-like phospholipase family protein [Cognataquiflexum nitidum]